MSHCIAVTLRRSLPSAVYRTAMDALSDLVLASARRSNENIPTLRRWVETNSFSRNLDGVNRMGDMLADDFACLGFRLERRRGTSVGDHLIWTSSAWDASPQRRLVLIGHHDIVFPPGTFEGWAETGDRVTGPGVLDMKGGIAVVLSALQAMNDIGALVDVPVAFVSVGDEEIGSPESRPLLETLARGAKGALVFEAGRTNDMIITRRKGTAKLHCAVTGKAAHAGNCHADGVSAIAALVRFITTAEAATDYDSGTTVNVGTVRGGTSANTVPADAECEIDFRFVAPQQGEILLETLDRTAREIAQHSGAGFTLTGGIRRAPLERSDDSRRLYEHYAACAGKAGLGFGECPLIGGGSDANTVSAIGVPAIDGLGPRGLGFHTHQEYIEVSSLLPKTEALARFLLSWRQYSH